MLQLKSEDTLRIPSSLGISVFLPRSSTDWMRPTHHTKGNLLSVQFSSVTQSCPALCDPMNHSTPGLPVHHQLLEFTQTQVRQVRDAIQPSHPLSSPSPPAPREFLFRIPFCNLSISRISVLYEVSYQFLSLLCIFCACLKTT